MDTAPTLEGYGLTLTPLTEADFAGLAEAASDPLIWELHPAKERATPDGFAAYIREMSAGGGMLVARRGDTIIGMSRFYDSPEEPGTWAIGFTFLIRAEWGGETNWQMKSLMLEHLFETQDQMLLHIASENMRSQAATRKLGAVHIDAAGIGASNERFRLTRAAWEKAKAARAA